MHELSIAMSIVEEAQKVAERERATRVQRVIVTVGELSGVESEPLQFAFPLASQGTLVEGSELVIERVPITVSCETCSRNGEIRKTEGFDLRCPYCGSPQTTVTRGRELLLRSLEVEKDD